MEMQFKTHVSKAGNSLAIFIPKVIAATLNLRRGDTVLITIKKIEESGTNE